MEFLRESGHAGEQTGRERDQAREEAARQEELKRRERAVDKARETFDRAKRMHERKAVSLDAERGRIEKRMQAEDERWALERNSLEDALRGARNR